MTEAEREELRRQLMQWGPLMAPFLATWKNRS